DEDVAGRAVLVEADVDVALVVADAELAPDLVAILGQALALLQRHRCRRRSRGVLLPRERLRDLAVVAVDRDRLYAELPGVEVEPGHLVDGRRLGQVHGLRDRAGDERLRGAHHLHVARVVDRALADR